MRDYKLIEHGTLTEFEEAVNAALAEGYVCIGGVAVATSVTYPMPNYAPNAAEHMHWYVQAVALPGASNK